MTHLETLILASVLLLGYSFVSHQISKAVQPLRLKVAADVQELCDDETIPDDVKKSLEHLAHGLFSKINGWLIVLILPVVVVRRAFRRRESGSVSSLPSGNRMKVTQTIAMGMFCMIASSPICIVIFAVEFLFALVIAAPWGWVRSLMGIVSSVDQRISTFGHTAK